MKKYLITILLIIISIISFAQITPRKLIGLDPITFRPGYIWLDTLRTIYYKFPLFVNADTVSISGGGSGGQWKQFNTAIHYDSGFVGINTGLTTPPAALLHIVTGNNMTSPIDSSGILLQTPFASTFTQQKYAPSLTWEATGWNTTTSASQKERFRMSVQGTSGSGGSSPSVYFQGAKDTVNYLNILSFNNGAATFYNTLVGTNASFSSSVSATNGFNSTGGNSGLNTTAGQTFIGQNPIPWLGDPSLQFQVYSNSQGVLFPKMSTSIRDSIGYSVGSVTVNNGGTGYTSPPNMQNTQSVLNPSAPLVNGAQSWGSNYFWGTPTISGGAVTSVAVTQGGYFNGAIKLNAVGGGGSGAVFTPNMVRILPNGFLFYNTTINNYQVRDSTNNNWTNIWNYANSYSTSASSQTTFTVTIGITMPSTLYNAVVIPSNSLSAAQFYINNKTTTTFDVVYLSPLTGTVSFDYTIFKQ